MYKLKFAVSLLLVDVHAVKYKCIFGPDVDGTYVEEVVDSGVALNCGDFCECEGQMNNICHFGPDITGKFIVETVSSERADFCDPTFCLCDTHDFEAQPERCIVGEDTIEPCNYETVLQAR